MTRNAAYLPKGVIGVVISLLTAALVLLLITASQPTRAAVADDEPQSESKKTALQLQQQIEEAQEAYAACREEAERVSNEINANRERIAEMEAGIPEQQERSSRAARELYKFQQQGVGVVELLLSADSMHDFIVGFEYVTKVSDANVEELNRLSNLKAEIDAAQVELEQSYAEANAKVDEAKKALEDLEAAQAEVQRRIEEEARMAAEIAAQAAVLAEQQRNNDSGPPLAQANPSPAPEQAAPAANPGEAASAAAEPAAQPAAAEPAAEPAAQPAAEPAAEPAEPASNTSEVNAPAPATGDEAAFIAEWAPRIDAYLAGSPLAGQGATFARAAYTYNVDPRWSPAISFTESSKGAVCFMPHNAWGWGSSSWDSWEEAIDAHVGGLSRGYGYTISEEAAQKYCPPNWQGWYERTLDQMNMI